MNTQSITSSSSDPLVLPPLLSLPVELHLQIASHLQLDEEDPLAVVTLRITSRYFRSIIPLPTHSALLTIDYETAGMNEYACLHCLRLRPASKFINSALKGKTGINGTQRYRRMYADCGFDVSKKERYVPGTKVLVAGVTRVLCRACREVKSGEEAGINACTKLCGRCYRRHGCICSENCVKEIEEEAKAPTQPLYLGRIAVREFREETDRPTTPATFAATAVMTVRTPVRSHAL